MTNVLALPVNGDHERKELELLAATIYPSLINGHIDEKVNLSVYIAIKIQEAVLIARPKR